MEDNFSLIDIENSLKQEFNSVSVTDYGNGTYCFLIDGMTEVYANETSLMSSSNDAFAYIPGSYGSDNDAKCIVAAVEAGNLNNGLYTIGYSCNDSGNSLDVIMRFSDCLNQDVSQLNSYGFSAGALATLKHSNDILSKYPDLNINAYLIDPFSIEQSHLNGIDLSNLVEGNIPIYVVGPNKNGVNYNREMCGPNIREVVKNLAINNNLNVAFLEEPVSSNGHGEINEEAIIALLLSGDPDISRYACLIYDEDTNDFKIGLTSAAAGLGEDFSIIMSMDDIETLNNNSSDCSPVLSDISLVMKNVNNISTTMNSNEGLFNTKTATVTSTAGIVNGVVSAQNVLFSISNDLHHRVRDELTLITKIAQNYYDMDGDLAALASTLKDANTINFTPEQAYTQINELINVQYDTSVTFFKNFQIPIINEAERIGSINIEDLNNLLNPSGSLMSNLQAEYDCAKNTKIEIDTFCDEIGVNLKGDVWNAVNGNLNVLSTMQNIRMEACDTLKQAVNQALDILKNYMSTSGYTELNTNEIPSLKLEIEALEAALAEKEEYVVASGVNEKGEPWVVKGTRYVIRGDDRRVKTETLNESKKLLATLEGLKDEVIKATNIINAALEEIYCSYGTVVSDFVSGTVNSYTPSFGGRVANFDYLLYNGTIPNLLGIPYINQTDFEGGMSKSGCGWASLAMILSGLTGVYIDPIELYERQTGKTYTGGEITPAQRGDLGVSSGDGLPSERQMEIFSQYGIQPEKLSLRGSPIADDIVQEAIASGKAVTICTESHYSILVPGENGEVVYMSSYFPDKNGTYGSVQEAFKAGGISAGNINYGVAYSTSDVPCHGANIPTQQYSPIVKNNPQIQQYTSSNTSSNTNSGGGYNYGATYSGIVGAPNTNDIVEPPKDEIIVEEPIEEIPIEENPSEEIPIEENPSEEIPSEENPSEEGSEVEKPIIKDEEILTPVPDNNVEPKPGISTKPNISPKPTYNIPNSYVSNNSVGTVQKPIENTADILPSINDIIEIPDSYVPDIENPAIDGIENQFDSFVPSQENVIKDLPLGEIKNKDGNEVAKAIATLAGVGTAVGAAAYGAHKYIKSREDNEEKSYDEDEDY